MIRHGLATLNPETQASSVSSGRRRRYRTLTIPPISG
jgi:hypothetical protein